MTAPIRYSPDLEQPEPDEAETFAALIEALQSITATTWQDSGTAIRGVHAKGHGLMHGVLTVAGDLPPELAQGLFARAGRYEARVRISTSPGDIMDDHVSAPRGLAIKVLGADGPTEQDFLFVDGPAFPVATPKAFVANLKLLAATTDRVEWLKRAFSATARGLEALIEAAGSKSGTLIGLGGHKLTNPLGETYYSQLPIRYGDHVVKVAAFPVSANLLALTDAPVDLSGKPDGLRAAVAEEIARAGGAWELRVQFNTGTASMPIEDASVVWPEAESPFRTVATLSVPPQSTWDAERVREMDDGMAFSPWHCLDAHRPLGGVMRARKPVYETLQGERSERSGCPFARAA